MTCSRGFLPVRILALALAFAAFAPAGRASAADKPRAVIFNEDLAAAEALRELGWNTVMAPPSGPMPFDYFFIRWSGTITPTENGAFDFGVRIQEPDAKARLTLEGQTVIAFDTPDNEGRREGSFRMRAGQSYPFVLEFRKDRGLAGISLEWRAEGGDWKEVPGAVLAPPPGAAELDGIDDYNGGVLGEYYYRKGEARFFYGARRDDHLRHYWGWSVPWALKPADESGDDEEAPLLEDARLVVLGAGVPLTAKRAAEVADFVRRGGGLLVTHAGNEPHHWWYGYRSTKHPPRLSPIWDALPFTQVVLADQRTHGLRNPFGPTRVLRQADSPLLEGVDLTQAPRFPSHGFMVLPTHPMVQGTHLLYSWSDDQYKSPLWSDGEVLAWGDDPEQRPLFLRARYGAGRTVAAAVPLFDPAFLAWPDSQRLLGNLVAWAVGDAPPAADAPPGPALYCAGAPWIVRAGLERMGFRLVDDRERADGAIVYGVPTPEQAEAVARLARAGRPVVIATADALRVAPLDALVDLPPALPLNLPVAATPAPTPETDGETLWNRRDQNHDCWWWDPDGAGETQAWYADENDPAELWRTQGESATRGTFVPAGSDTARTGSVQWEPEYRWRLEGNIADRRDFIEGWQAPDYNDDAWTKQESGFGKDLRRSLQPQPPEAAGVQPKSFNLLMGSFWARARFTLDDPAAATGSLLPPEGARFHHWGHFLGLANPHEAPRFVTFLDGKPMNGPVPLRTLAPGEHTVAVRIWPFQHVWWLWANDHPWGADKTDLVWPTVQDSPWRTVPAEKGEDDGYQNADHDDWPSGWPEAAVAGWFQIRLDAHEGRLPLLIEDPSGRAFGTRVWIDGKPLGGLPRAVDLAALPEGEHVLTLFKPVAEELSIRFNERAWYRGVVHLDGEDNWNAVWIGANPAGARLYVNGQRVLIREGMTSVAWQPGPNRIDWAGLPSIGTVPEYRLARLAVRPAPVDTLPAERLHGVWYRRDDPGHQALAENWPGVLADPTPPEGWTPFVPTGGEGGVDILPDERARWYAVPFLVDEAEAFGPTRLVVDGPLGAYPHFSPGAAPPDVIKTLWINGHPVSAETEFYALKRHETHPGYNEARIVFPLAGHLRPGLNWLAFPVDLQGVYGLDLAMPMGMAQNWRQRRDGWIVPLPKLDVSGAIDKLRWEGPFANMDAAWVRRGPLAPPPADAEVLARYLDGAPAVARRDNLTFALGDLAKDWSLYLDRARVDWARSIRSIEGDDEQNNTLHPFNLWQTNHLFIDALALDGAQVAAALWRGGSDLLGVDPLADGGMAVHLAPAAEERALSWQHRNWQGMLLAEGRIEVPIGVERVELPAPTFDPSPMTTAIRPDRGLRLALLSDHGQRVRDYLETVVVNRPDVEMALSPTDQALRRLPDEVPGAAHYRRENMLWNLTADQTPVGVVVPGEPVRVRVMARNRSDRPQSVVLDLAWKSAFAPDRPTALDRVEFTLRPFEQQTVVLACGFRAGDMAFTPLPDGNAAALALDDGGIVDGPDLLPGRVVAMDADGGEAAAMTLVAVRPWRRSSEWRRPPSQYGAPAGFEMMQFGFTPSLESATDPKHVGWGSEQGGFFHSAVDWWRDHFVNTSGNGGGFAGFGGRRNFAWGGWDRVWESFDRHAIALDNAGYLPDGTQYQEALYARVAREYNRFMRGNQPLHMEVADFWGCGEITPRERNFIHFLRWRQTLGRPLTVHTGAELAERLKNDPEVAEDWRIFRRDGYRAWTDQLMAGIPPGSTNASQGETINYLISRTHDDLEVPRSLVAAHNTAFIQPSNIRRRGEISFGWMRALAPATLLGDDHWYYQTGHSQTIGDAWGETGSVLSTPEWARVMNLDASLMGLLGNDGEVQPLINQSFNAKNMSWGPVPLFSYKQNQNTYTSSAPEILGREVTYHLYHLIQPERVIGSWLTPSLEYIAPDKLEGQTIIQRIYAQDDGSAMVLAHALRNFGALWGGLVSPELVDRLGDADGVVSLMPSGAPPEHAEQLAGLVRRGGHAGVLFSTGGTTSRETPLANLFGVRYAPLPDEAREGAPVMIGDREIPLALPTYGVPQYVQTTARSSRDFVEGRGALAGRALLRGVETPGGGRAVFSSLNGGQFWGWDHDMARALAQAVNWAAGDPVTLPEGVSGYAFEARGLIFVVLQDLRATGGSAPLRVKVPTPGAWLAADAFSGRSVTVKTAGDDTVTLAPELLPNGSTIIVLGPAAAVR